MSQRIIRQHDAERELVLPLHNMKDDPAPNNVRVLVYRPEMADSDIGPWTVMWGWAARRDAAYWAELPAKIQESEAAGNGR